MDASDVSFVVIAFNEAEHIADCLDAIFAQQGATPHEVIVVDDASTDRTYEVVAAKAGQHPNLKLLRHEQNRGRGAARRTGQDAATTSVIAFIDADIWIPQDWLKRALEELADYDVISGVAVPDGDCAVIWRIFGPVPKGRPPTWALTGSNVIFRTEALKQVGWPAGTRLTEDNRLARALVAAGFRVRTVPDLQAEHHEAKSYRKTLAFMYETGFNSTEILRDLRLVRVPDVVWALWTVSCLGAVATSAAGLSPWWVAPVWVLGFTAAIDAVWLAQRFFVTRTPGRWLAAWLGNFPMIATYLASRTLHAPRLLLPRKIAEH